MKTNKTYEETRELLDYVIKNDTSSGFILAAQLEINKMYAELIKAMRDSIIFGTGLVKFDEKSYDSGDDSK